MIEDTMMIPLKLYMPEQSSIIGYTVAVHGFGGDKESSAIRLLAEKLTAKGYIVAAFDLPCHGESSYDSSFTVKESRNCLKAVFVYMERNYQNVSEKAVFATSFGGYITLLELAAMPSDLKIVLRAPAVNMKDTFENSLLPVTMDEFMKKGADMGFERIFRVDSAFLDELNCNDISKTNMNTSMLIIHGNKDAIVLPQHISTFTEVNPKAVLKTINGADHRFKSADHLDQAVNAAIHYILYHG